MTYQSCPKYEICSAPICLDDPISTQMIWYPDEEICLLKKYSKNQVVRNQKKIAKKARNRDFYFTYEMLNRDFVIKRGIEGLNPEVSEEDQLKQWLKKHPIKKPLSEDQKNAIRDRFKRYAQVRRKKKNQS